MEKIAKKKGKKPAKKMATPTFNADINLDQQQPDIPEKVEKIEVDEISITKKIESKGDAQPLIEVKEEKVQPFCIEETQDNATTNAGKLGNSQANQQVNVPHGIVQDIVPEEFVKPILQEHPLQQQTKEQQANQLQPSEKLYSHTIQSAYLTANSNEQEVENHAIQQPRQVQQEPEVKKPILEDEEQDQLAQSLKEDPKSKAKVTKKTTKKSKVKPKAAASAILAVESIIDFDEFNESQEVKPKSQIIANVEQKRQNTVIEIIETRQPQVVSKQEEKSAEPEIVQNTVNEVIAEVQFKYQPLEHAQLKNAIEKEEKAAEQAQQQDKKLHHEEQQVIKQQIAVGQQVKIQVKEEIIPARNIQEEVETEMIFSLQDSKPKQKILKKNTKKGGKKTKTDKNKQLTDDNIFEVKENQQIELPKPAQIIPQPQIDTVENFLEMKEQQKVEERIEVFEQKHQQIEPNYVQTEQKQEVTIQQPSQFRDKKEPEQKEVTYPSQNQNFEPEPTFTQQPAIIQQTPIIEQPVLEPQRQEAPVVKKEVEEDEEIQALSFADPLKPKTNKATKKTAKKQKGKAKEEKNAMIGENMLNFDIEVVKNQQPPKHEEKIDRVEEISSNTLEVIQIVQQQAKTQTNEQIVQQPPLHKIIETHPVTQQKISTKPIEKLQQPKLAPTISLSSPQSKKEIVSQLISLIRFHNDQEIKTMRERMQMLQEDIFSRMGRSKTSSIRSPSKNPDYYWIIEQNIALHGQYKSLNKN